MTDPSRAPRSGVPTPGGAGGPVTAQAESANLADILERVLDKGIVIAGDIQINLLDIELLTIKLRLIVASVDTARRMGINWWESDPALTTNSAADRTGALGDRVERLERQLEQAQAAIERDDTEPAEQAELEREPADEVRDE